jgi:protein-S-isoprenylcysteine O-methyltransferase Ste14
MLQIAALTELIVCWVVWLLAFLKPARLAAGQKKVVRARESRWGMALVTLSFAFLWAFVRPAGFEKSAISLTFSMLLGPPSVLLAWAATRRLGKQWRYEAALTGNHELIQSGPYSLVRHPIYLSVLGMQLATGCAWTWWPMFLAAIGLNLVGTEIRMRAEDRLLAEHFKESFAAYRSKVLGFLPFIR